MNYKALEKRCAEKAMTACNVSSVIRAITEGLVEDGEVVIPGFGKLTAKPAMFKKPITGEPVKGIKFGLKAFQGLKDRLMREKDEQ